MTLSTSSFKALWLAAVVILGVESLLTLAPPTITCLGAQPDLGDLLNASADERTIRTSRARILILGDSTAIYGVHPDTVEKIVNAPVENISRTIHYGLVGLQKVLEEALKSHPDVRLVVMPLSQRLFTSSDEEALRGGYLDRFLKAHKIHDRERNLGNTAWIPSMHLSGEVTRLMFFDTDRIYFGRYSFRQWQALCEEGRGSLRLPDVHHPTRGDILREFNRPAQAERGPQLAALCRMAQEKGLQVLVVMTPISITADRILREVGVMTTAESQLREVAGLLPPEALFDPAIPVFPDEAFCDTVHLNSTGNDAYSAQVAAAIGGLGPALK
ncbi:MAG: hypothetical protein AB7F75_05095 [Planctomycetota bacterium]